MKKKTNFFLVSCLIILSVVSTGFPREYKSSPVFIRDSAAGDKWDRIAITANGDIPTYADSGSGTSGDPWIIEDYHIDCNGSGSGISIQNTDEYITIINCSVNESGTGATDACIGFGYAANIRVEDCVVNAAGGRYAFGDFYGDNIILDNVSLANSSENNIYLYETTNSQFTNIISKNSTGTNVFVTGITGDPHDILLDNINAANGTYGANSLVHLSKGYEINVTNSFFSNTTGGVDPKGIKINADDVVIENCTVQDTDMAIYMFGNDNASIINNTLHGRLDGIHAQAGNSNNNYIAYNTIGSHDDTNFIGDCFAFTNCENNTFYNNTCLGSWYNTTDSAFCMRNSDNDIIQNNYISGFDRSIQYITTASTNLTIINNTIHNSTITVMDLATITTINVTNNSFIDNPGLYGLEIDNPASITYNNFSGNELCIKSNTPTLNVNLNYFADNTQIFSGTCSNFSYNYYQDYFDYFPYAITVGGVLEHEYEVTGSLNDTAPLYYAAWYPRDTQVFFNFYSNVDYQGVPFEQLQLYIDDVRVTTPSPVIEHLLFTVRVHDYSGRLLHEITYNLNGSGIYINIGLELSVSVHFRFYSNLDYFGLVFELVKLYVNTTRITTPSPTMRPSIILVTVRDYADIVIYNQTIDLHVAGIYLDIGLDIAPISIINKYNRSVVFHLIRGGVGSSFAIGSSMQLKLRLALGDYTYIITELDGTQISEHEITFRADRPGEFAISFGFITFPPIPEPVYQTQLLDYVILMAIIGTVIGAMVLAAWWVKGRVPGMNNRGKRSRKKQSGEYMRVVSR